MSLDDNIRDNDEVYTSHDVKVIVDDRTLAYLQSAEIKFVEQNGRSGFQIEKKGPQTAPSGCASCGPSGCC
jgi:Fe-S cluster assembly iron-binding protein IscA